MARPSLRWLAVAVALASALLAAGGWPPRPAALGDSARRQGVGWATIAQPRPPDFPARLRDVQSDESARRPSGSAEALADPLLAHDLRLRLEDGLLEAGAASDPTLLKQRLAGAMGPHFPAALATRALALAERYVDYQAALGALRAPQEPTDPRALRNAFEAREKIRLRFFDAAEYKALFAREVELDRYTLARLEVAHKPQLTPEQRARAWQATQEMLTPEHLAERQATTQHMTVAAQTAAFNAQSADVYQRHAMRSAQFGEAAAHALAALDREEKDWQQRLDRYSQARAGDPGALQRLRQQLFSGEELQRVDAALAWRELQATAAAS